MQFNNSVQFKLPRFIVFEKNDCDRRTGIQMSDLKMDSVLAYGTPKNKKQKIIVWMAVCQWGDNDKPFTAEGAINQDINVNEG